MSTSPAEPLARVVLRQYLGVHRGDRVVVECWSHALAIARGLVVAARQLGAEPLLAVEDEAAFFEALEDRGHLPAPVAPTALAEHCDAYVYLGGPEAYPRLFGLPPQELEPILDRHGAEWWAAARRSRLRAVRWAISDVTPSAAERYGVDRESWRHEVEAGSRVAPMQLRRFARAYVGPLARARRLELRHPNGTHLTVRLGERPCIVEAGPPRPSLRSPARIWTQVPTGLVAVPLPANAVEGSWEANRPVHHRYADPATALGARFVFGAGRLKEFSFDRGGESFARAFAGGGRGREVPGALLFGLNPQIARAPELEEIAAGSIGLLLGDARPVGGRNRSRFSYITTIRGADVDLDGRRWIVGGHPARTPGPTPPRRSAAPTRSARRPRQGPSRSC